MRVHVRIRLCRLGMHAYMYVCVYARMYDCIYVRLPVSEGVCVVNPPQPGNRFVSCVRCEAVRARVREVPPQRWGGGWELFRLLLLLLLLRLRLRLVVGLTFDDRCGGFERFGP